MNKDRSGRALWVVSSIVAGSLAVSSSLAAEPSEFDEEPMEMNSPGSIVDRLEEDAAQKDYLVQFPGANGALKPWYDMKKNLANIHGFKFGISYTAFHQEASDTFGPEDNATGFDFDISGTWDIQGPDSTSPTTLGFSLFWRDNLNNNLLPQKFFTRYGGLYSGAAPYGENDPAIGELWIQQKYDNVWGFRVGKIFPITAYDFFPFKNFRTDFVDYNHVTNSTIPLPGNGLGAFVQYRPIPKIMLRLGVHDANADVEKSGFDTYEGELFTILEAGMDIGLMPRKPGRPPFGHVHVSLWHQDERDDDNIDDGWGVGVSAVQRFGRYSPFLRYGYADVTKIGPTPVKHMINGGLAIDDIFGQSKDRIGIGYTWNHPADTNLDNEQVVDSYYRVQLTPEIQIGPTLEVIFEPTRSQDDDTVYVWGFRTRVAL